MAALVCCASGFLVACEPPLDGFMGLTVDAAGRPVAVMQICEHVDGVTIYSETPSIDPDQSPTMTPAATWIITPAASGFVQFPLSGGGEWQLQGQRKPLRVKTEYSLHAWSSTGSPRTGYATFSPGGLKKLKYGQVHMGGLKAESADPAASELTMPLADFRTGLCT